MARRVQKRRVIERGWLISSDEIGTTATGVDNPVTVVGDPIVSWDDLVDIDENDQLAGQDDFADYYVEVVKGASSYTGTAGATNLTEFVQFCYGFIVGEVATFADLPNSLSPLLVAEPFWTEQWRSAETVRQVLMARFAAVVGEVAAPRDAYLETAAVNGNEWFQPFQLGQIHLRRGEAVYPVLSQTGVGSGLPTPFGQPWVPGDTVFWQYQTSILVRKKRGA